MIRVFKAFCFSGAVALVLSFVGATTVYADQPVMDFTAESADVNPTDAAPEPDSFFMPFCTERNPNLKPSVPNPLKAAARGFIKHLWKWTTREIPDGLQEATERMLRRYGERYGDDIVEWGYCAERNQFEVTYRSGRKVVGHKEGQHQPPHFTQKHGHLLKANGDRVGDLLIPHGNGDTWRWTGGLD